MKAMLMLLVVLAGCSDPMTTGPTQDEFYSLVCIEKTYEHPLYNCVAHDTYVIVLEIENPNVTH